MQLHEIVCYGNPRLQEPSAPVSTVDAAVRELVADMFRIMYDAPGVGLAAPQIGVNKRIFVVGFEEKRQKTELAVINPKITGFFGEEVPYEEGCLSVPGISALVMRPSGIMLEGLDLEGKPFTIRTDGFLARVIQHEYDHLEGKLFVDRLDAEEMERIAGALKRLGKRTKKKLAG